MAARKKTRTKKDENIIFLSQTLDNQGRAVREGPRIKKFTLHDLRSIKPLTYGQTQLFESYFGGANIVANGSAGTGKSYCAVYLALTDILREDSIQKEIIIVRSAVPSREIGHLPGEISDKLSPYEEPYRDIFASLLKKADAYDTMKESGKVRFMATSFVRGLTWDNAIVIFDEVQSCNSHEISSVITRLGDNSKLIICGDVCQNDLIYRKGDISGYTELLTIMGKMEEVEIVTFTERDIVRSGFVKSFIIAKQSV
jgi:phosphate starvation-inducible protein PhoH and related proteins